MIIGTSDFNAHILIRYGYLLKCIYTETFCDNHHYFRVTLINNPFLNIKQTDSYNSFKLS